MNDYLEMLGKAGKNCDKVIHNSLNFLINGNLKSRHFDIGQSDCKLKVDSNSEVVFFNPLAFKRKEMVCVQVTDPKLLIVDDVGELLSVQQVDPHIHWKAEKLMIDPNKYKLYALIELGPMEYKSFSFTCKFQFQFSFFIF